MERAMSHFEEALTNFLTHYDELSAVKDDAGFASEFIALKTKSQVYRDKDTYPAEAGQMPVNKKKNRFKDILPFEYTRVSLHPVEGIEGSDYINANYVTGAEDDVDYIAAQGPLPNTVGDFWRMLWYHSIEIVVMACKNVEMGKHKCEPYWPALNESLNFGAIKVTTTMEENISNDFVIRDLLAECEGEQQVIRQYHYTAWPDHGKPKSPEPILKMIDMVRDFRQRPDIPVVVNCSAGCGRTGTILAIDIARSMILSKAVPKNFSVYKIVEKMRQQRPAMVQAKDQYLFVYQAVSELCRKALGMAPPPDPIPRPSRSSGSKTSVEESSRGKTEASSETKAIYENTKDLASQEPLDGATIPPSSSSNAGYVNVGPNRDGVLKMENGSARTKPLPSPPVKPKQPVARKRSSGVTSSSASEGLLPSQKPLEAASKKEEEEKGGEGGVVYENLQNELVKAKAPQPSPKPKPRANTQTSDASSSSQPNHISGTLPATAAAAAVGANTKKLASTEVKARHLSPSSSPSPAPPVAPRASTPEKQKPLPDVPKDRSPERGGGGHSKKPLPMTPADKEIEKSHSHKPLPQVPPAAAATAAAPKEKQGGDGGTESLYSLVAEGADTGPEILVVDEKTGKSAPLGERSLDSSKLSASGNKSSILETILSAMDGISLSGNEESDEDNPPALPPPMKVEPPPPPSLVLSDEVAPDIPRRTDARLELVGGGPTRFEDPVKTPGAVEISDPDAGVYEQPTMYSTPVKERSSPLRVGSPTAPTATANSHPESSSTASSISTLPRVIDSGSGGLGEGLGGGGGGQRSKGFMSMFKKGAKDKKKIGARDISGPIGNPGSLGAPAVGKGMVKSTSDQGIHSATLTSTSSLEATGRAAGVPGLDSANIRYKFPGEMGYGIRIPKPRGPRNEPSHWRHFTPNNVK